MNFNNNLPEWKNTGTEPSESLKTNGFAGGYRPPADVFNWFWSKVIKAITEIQTKLTSFSTSDITSGTLPIARGGTGATTAAGIRTNLGIVLPTVITGTLAAGSTSLTLTNGAIQTNSIIDVYTSIYGVNPKSITVSNGSINLTFDAQTSAVSVRIEVR